MVDGQCRNLQPARVMERDALRLSPCSEGHRLFGNDWRRCSLKVAVSALNYRVFWLEVARDGYLRSHGVAAWKIQVLVGIIAIFKTSRVSPAQLSILHLFKRGSIASLLPSLRCKLDACTFMLPSRLSFSPQPTRSYLIRHM